MHQSFAPMIVGRPVLREYFPVATCQHGALCHRQWAWASRAAREIDRALRASPEGGAGDAMAEVSIDGINTYYYPSLGATGAIIAPVVSRLKNFLEVQQGLIQGRRRRKLRAVSVRHLYTL